MNCAPQRRNRDDDASWRRQLPAAEAFSVGA